MKLSKNDKAKLELEVLHQQRYPEPETKALLIAKMVFSKTIQN